jgi:hypothetical protein
MSRRYVKGQRLIGAAYPAKDPRRARIKKDLFLTSTLVTRHAALPPGFEAFQDAADEADRLAAAAPSLADIEARLAQTRRKIEDLRAAVRRK